MLSKRWHNLWVVAQVVVVLSARPVLAATQQTIVSTEVMSETASTSSPAVTSGGGSSGGGGNVEKPLPFGGQVTTLTEPDKTPPVNVEKATSTTDADNNVSGAIISTPVKFSALVTAAKNVRGAIGRAILGEKIHAVEQSFTTTTLSPSSSSVRLDAKKYGLWWLLLLLLILLIVRRANRKKKVKNSSEENTPSQP